MDITKINLEDVHCEQITPTIPFSFDGTFFKPSHFPTPDLFFDGTAYWQTLKFNGNTYGLKISNQGDEKNPCVQFQIFYDKRTNSTPDFQSILDEISYRFDLKSNIKPFTDAFEADRILGPVINKWPGMRVSTPYSFYEFTVITAVLQNTVVRRSVQMMNNLFNAYGTKVYFDGKELFAFWDFNKLASVAEDELRALKVGYRAKTFTRQAIAFRNLDVERLRRISDTGTLRKELLSLYGIGPASVQYIMFEVFHHYDACDHIPPWEQKIYSRLLFDSELVDTSTLLREIDNRWGKWKMLAMHYIFEDLFWKRKHEKISWLEPLIRL